MNLLLAFAIAMLIAMVLIPPLGRLAARLHVLDQPGERKVHTAPMPRVGGIALAMATLLPVVLWLPLDAQLRGYLTGALWLVVFGVLDDRYSHSPAGKALAQLAGIALFLLLSGVHFDSFMLADRVALPEWLGFGLTGFFLLAVTNAVNLADGLDGLAGGLALLSCATLALLGESLDREFPLTLGVILAGALLGFLRFNTWPARVFMGDAGSQFLGFTLGVLALDLVQNNNTPVSATLPLLLVGLPVVDTLSVMLLRMQARRSPFAADRRHLHHRLLALGFDHYEAVAVIYTLQCALLVLAWNMRFGNDLLIVAAFALMVLACVAGIGLLEARGWRWRRAGEGPGSPLARSARWLTAGQRLPRWALRTAALSTMAYWLGVALYAGPIPADVHWMAAAAALLLAVGFAWRRSELVRLWLVRGTLYVAVITAVFLDHRSPQKAAVLQAMKFVFLPLLALAVVTAVRLSKEKRFGATPLDLLLVFGALALPNLPGLQATGADLGISVAKLFALSYAVELVSTLSSRLRMAVHGAGLAFFALIAIRGFV